MSNENKREELKAKINEQLDKLSIEDLEKVAGGYIVIGGDEYVCHECGKSFWSQAHLNWHIEQEHSSGYVK